MRIKRVVIHPMIFARMLEEGEIHVKCIKGLPKEAKFCYMFQSEFYRINAVFEHESFELLNDGQVIPELVCEFEKL